MNSIIEFNRNTLGSVNQWIKKEDWDLPNSLFNYGLPHRILHLIDAPINNDNTEADMICKYILDLSKINNINYLEIGVSVGKTFYQVITFSKQHLSMINESTFSCLDIEKVNPTFERLLDNEYGNKAINEIKKDETLTNSIRKSDKNIITRWNNITYYEADEFDTTIWKNMPQKYNFIFSDALHDPIALLKEYENIKTNSLLDEKGFIYCFDDLEHDETMPMWSAVNTIYSDIVQTNPSLHVTIEHIVVNGWIGQHEYPHNFGVIKAFPQA